VISLSPTIKSISLDQVVVPIAIPPSPVSAEKGIQTEDLLPEIEKVLNYGEKLAVEIKNSINETGLDTSQIQAYEIFVNYLRFV